jgi:DivIVA domain-containing protein
MNARYADLIDRIKNAQFRAIRFKPGYDEGDVDKFLDRLVATLRESALPSYDELQNVQFATTRLKPGYVMQDVDRFLQEIAEAIGR